MKSLLLEWFPLNPWIVWPLAAFMVAFALQLWFYGGPYSAINKVARRRKKGLLPQTNERPPVSVICVCS